MLSKCANSSCSTAFLYLHDGKLFRMDVADTDVASADIRKPPRRLEFFWLCNECAASMTLTYKQGVGVVATPRQMAKVATAS
jgi:hypothetical protein